MQIYSLTLIEGRDLSTIGVYADLERAKKDGLDVAKLHEEQHDKLRWQDEFHYLYVAGFTDPTTHVRIEIGQLIE